jgi:hypothetical protein
MNRIPTGAARYAYLLLAVAVGCSLPSMVAAQERPFDTTACALTQHPDKYNEGFVSVEGLITVGPEEFMLHDANCGDEHGKIWLEFGGGVESPANAANAHAAKNRPQTFESLELPLTRDRDFDALQKLLKAAGKTGRTRMLRATLIGKYFAGHPTKTASGESIRAGYGPKGCCSLLIIEEVGTVGTDIEDPVDFSASPSGSLKPPKDCTVSELPVPSREDEDRLLRKSLEEEFAYLHDAKQVVAHAIAEREGIGVDEAEPRLKADSVTATTAAYKWLAPDGMKSYFITVDKPYWLLQTAVSGDAVIWVPKSITKTECIRKPRESL